MILQTRGDELWRILLPRNRNFRSVVKCGAQRRTYKAFVFSRLQQEKSWASRIFCTVHEVRCGLRHPGQEDGPIVRVPPGHWSGMHRTNQWYDEMLVGNASGDVWFKEIGTTS